jgi:hypothetical protein
MKEGKKKVKERENEIKEERQNSQFVLPFD